AARELAANVTVLLVGPAAVLPAEPRTSAHPTQQQSRRAPMKSLHYLTIAVAATFIASSVPSFAASRSEESREKTIQMSQVPKPAVDAATKALGATPTEAKIVN